MKYALGAIVGLLLAATPYAAGQLVATQREVAVPLPENTVFSPSLRFEGRVVEKLANGQTIREVAVMRGRKFVWQGRLPRPRRRTGTAGRHERSNDTDRADDSRGTGQGPARTGPVQRPSIQEAEPAFDLADEVLRLREQELRQSAREASVDRQDARTGQRPLHARTGTAGAVVPGGSTRRWLPNRSWRRRSDRHEQHHLSASHPDCVRQHRFDQQHQRRRRIRYAHRSFHGDVGRTCVLG